MKQKTPTTVAPATRASKVAAEIRVSIGGTSEEPIYTDAALAPLISAGEVAASGDVLKKLALNILAGVISESLLSSDGQKRAFAARSVKDSKTAFIRLLGCKAADIRAAWEREQQGRKRLTEPTLQALARAMREPGEAPPEPVGKLVAAIISGKGAAADKIKAIRALPGVGKYLAESEAS